MDLPSPTPLLTLHKESKTSAKAQDAQKGEKEERDTLVATRLSHYVYDDDAPLLNVESELDVEMAVLRNGMVRNLDEGTWEWMLVDAVDEVDADAGFWEDESGSGDETEADCGLRVREGGSACVCDDVTSRLHRSG